jgi:hypothetical protein
VRSVAEAPQVLVDDRSAALKDRYSCCHLRGRPTSRGARYRSDHPCPGKARRQIRGRGGTLRTAGGHERIGFDDREWRRRPRTPLVRQRESRFHYDDPRAELVATRASTDPQETGRSGVGDLVHADCDAELDASVESPVGRGTRQREEPFGERT